MHNVVGVKVSDTLDDLSRVFLQHIVVKWTEQGQQIFNGAIRKVFLRR